MIKTLKNNERGITLVALVVTILVLLLLAGIGIVNLSGDKSIIKMSQETKNRTEAERGQVEGEIGDLENELKEEYKGPKPEVDPDIDPTKPKAEGISLNAKFCVVTGGESWKNNFTLKPTITPADANQVVKWTSSNNSIATVDSNGKVKATQGGKGGDVIITATTRDGTNKVAECNVRVEMFGAINSSGNGTYTDNSSQETHKTVTIPKGYAVGTSNNINKIDGGLVIQDIEGNQFVWVPVDETAYSKMIDETNHRGKLYDFGSYDSTTQVYTPYTSPKLITSAIYGEPNTVTSYTDSSSDTTYPGDDIKENYTNAGITGVTDEATFKTRLQNEFNSMADSIKNNKGFFIGRYETGNLVANSTNVPVVQRGNTKIGNVNWYYMYAQGQRIAKSSNVTSSMIWGCQWDRTLDWIVTRNGGDYALVTSSEDWGNHKDTTFEYLDADGTTKEKSTNKVIPTGSTERNKKNNIYDMAGNNYDWTLEAYYTNRRVNRGGTSTSSTPAYIRGLSYPSSAFEIIRCQTITLCKVKLKDSFT